MANISRSRLAIRKLVYFAFLAALVVVLQILASYIKVGAVSICLVLIPIVLGGIILNTTSGALLGAAFGLLTFFLGLVGFDVGTNAMIQYKPLETFLICVIKGLFAGLVSALAYKLMMKLTKDKLLPSSIVAFVVAPIVNTSIYIVGVALFFKDFYGFTQESAILLLGAIFLAIVVNFVSELILNAICGPSVTFALSKVKSIKEMIYH